MYRVTHGGYADMSGNRTRIAITRVSWDGYATPEEAANAAVGTVIEPTNGTPTTITQEWAAEMLAAYRGEAV